MTFVIKSMVCLFMTLYDKNFKVYLFMTYYYLIHFHDVLFLSFYLVSLWCIKNEACWIYHNLSGLKHSILE